MARRLYEVLTWDGDRRRFTPQRGVRKGPYTLFGTRRALRRLGTMGYAGRPSEPMVKVREWKMGAACPTV